MRGGVTKKVQRSRGLTEEHSTSTDDSVARIPGGMRQLRRTTSEGGERFCRRHNVRGLDRVQRFDIAGRCYVAPKSRMQVSSHLSRRDPLAIVRQQCEALILRPMSHQFGAQ